VVRTHAACEVFSVLLPETTRRLPAGARAKSLALLAARGPAFSKRHDMASSEAARAVARRIGLRKSVSARVGRGLQPGSVAAPPANRFEGSRQGGARQGLTLWLMRTLYMTTAGSSDPTRASIPLHLAVNGSLEVGHDVGVVLAGDATELLKTAVRNHLEGVGVPPMRDLLAKARQHNLPIYV
jgi:hypothetical protein